MALKVVWAQAALLDLDLAAEYIARDSPRYAAAFIREAIEASRSLRSLSKRGRIVPEINDANIRELLVCNYRLIYRITPDALYILAYIHGSRDLWNLWQKRRGHRS